MSNQTKAGSMRETMVQTSAFIDACREAFGAAYVNGQIRQGMKGAPTFFAKEAGHEIGTRRECGLLIGWHPVTKCAIEVKP